MNLVKLSSSYEYLYSPKSWLHFKSKKIKLGTVIAHLICLQFISLKHMLAFLIILLCLLRSVIIPKYLKAYFCQGIGTLVFFLVINIKHYSKCPDSKQDLEAYYALRPNSFENNLKKRIRLNDTGFYLSASIVRLAIIHLIYLVLIRYFLLTTDHRSIIKITLMRRRYVNSYSTAKFIFAINASSQFLKIIFEEIEAIRISCVLRRINLNKSMFLNETLRVFASCLEQLVLSIISKIFCIAHSLYSRDIKYCPLNIYS